MVGDKYCYLSCLPHFIVLFQCFPCSLARMESHFDDQKLLRPLCKLHTTMDLLSFYTCWLCFTSFIAFLPLTEFKLGLKQLFLTAAKHAGKNSLLQGGVSHLFGNVRVVISLQGAHCCPRVTECQTGFCFSTPALLHEILCCKTWGYALLVLVGQQ